MDGNFPERKRWWGSGSQKQAQDRCWWFIFHWCGGKSKGKVVYFQKARFSQFKGTLVWSAVLSTLGVRPFVFLLQNQGANSWYYCKLYSPLLGPTQTIFTFPHLKKKKHWSLKSHEPRTVAVNFRLREQKIRRPSCPDRPGCMWRTGRNPVCDGDTAMV